MRNDDFVTRDDLDELEGERIRRDFVKSQRQFVDEVNTERILRSLIGRVSALEDTVRSLRAR